MIEVRAFTDGGCSGNPGPGGWGVLLQAIQGGRVVKEKELSGGKEHTTNNKMELFAAIQALEALNAPTRITVITDSAYVKDGITKWINGWKRQGWARGPRKALKNADLWRRLDQACEPHEVSWEWTKGHAGNPGNERADKLAHQGMRPFLR